MLSTLAGVVCAPRNLVAPRRGALKSTGKGEIAAALWAIKEFSLEATHELIDCLKNRESAEKEEPERSGDPNAEAVKAIK
jgi:hypothetical protein